MDNKGESSSSHQVDPADGVYAPVTPAKPAGSETTIMKDWLRTPFDEALFEDTPANNNFSCWERNLGPTMYNPRVSMDDLGIWNIPCRDLLALADANGSLKLHNFISDLNAPPPPEPDVITQFTPVTPDQSKKANVHQQSHLIIEQSQEADSSTVVQSNQDTEKGLSDQINLNETPQQTKQRRRKHRPKVIKERKPRTAKKPATPNPDGSSTGKRKYVRKKPVEKSPIAEGEIIDLTTDEQQSEKSCKRKINFDEVEAIQVDHPTANTPTSINPITPSKTEKQKGRLQSGNINKAKCRLNFLQETHDKVAIHVSSPNESNCSTSADLSNQKIDGNQMLPESIEAYLSAFTNYSSGMQLPVIYNNKIIENNLTSITSVCVVPNVNNAPGDGSSSKASSKKRVRKTKGLSLVNNSPSFQQHITTTTTKRVKKTSVVSSVYNNQINFTNNIGVNIIWEVEGLIKRFEHMDIHDNAIVPFQGHGSVVPYDGLFNPIKKRKPRPKVDLDDETSRVWRLLLEDINSQGIDGTDENKAKWWEEERRVFRGRAESFIARMHLVQGDRRFSRWKGSVLDSVIGVFLTQNVSDHLSSSAFMSLVSRYPAKSKSTSEPRHEENDSVLSVVQEVEENETIMLQVVNSCEKSQQVYIVDLNENSECGVDDVISSQNSTTTDTSPSSVQSPIGPIGQTTEEPQPKDGCQARVENGLASFVELLHTQGSSTTNNDNNCEKTDLPKECGSEESGLSAESASVQMVKTVISEKTSEVREAFHKVVEFSSGDHGSSEIVKGDDNNNNNNKGGFVDKVRIFKKKQVKVEWDKLRIQAEVKEKKERPAYTMDALDYEALMNADASDIADAIKERGMNNVLAARIKALLDRIVSDHGRVDLEWLRDVPPDKAKEYLLSFRGLGLKSVECVRLLTLHHLAFPVDTNVGRIAVRLGWVPLQPLPESLQLHLLELYPVLESIQKYLWPRLCKLDQKTLYELHYQMITFGKVFCTKSKPNCNACPMRGECRHFASAFASARLGLPAPEGSLATLPENTSSQKLIDMPHQQPTDPQQFPQVSEVQNCNPEIEIEQPSTPLGPIVEVPASPEPIIEVPTTPETQHIQDMEDFCEEEGEEIPMIKLNMEQFTQNLQTYMERHMELGESGMSKALVALTSEAAAIPAPKLKSVSQLRTEHQVYVLPDSHPLLEGLDTREPDDPCSYLLAIWTPGETADSIQPPAGQCLSQESGTLCNEETCFFCNSTREANAQTVRGTLLIPCRTAMRGTFPLNGTYFQVNEVFADHDSSLNPIDVPRSWLWNLPRRTVYFGTSIPTIFKGLTTEDIQCCFWRGFVCVRGFDQKTRAPRPLMARLHFPASKRAKTKTDAN
ncbi:hypothetical protein LXL04_005054 [Taraxacum kok-saghyz]